MLQYQLLHRLDRAVSPCCPTTASSTTRSVPARPGSQDSLEQSLPTEQLAELIRRSTIEDSAEIFKQLVIYFVVSSNGSITLTDTDTEKNV